MELFIKKNQPGSSEEWYGLKTIELLNTACADSPESWWSPRVRVLNFTQLREVFLQPADSSVYFTFLKFGPYNWQFTQWCGLKGILGSWIPRIILMTEQPKRSFLTPEVLLVIYTSHSQGTNCLSLPVVPMYCRRKSNCFATQTKLYLIQYYQHGQYSVKHTTINHQY